MRNGDRAFLATCAALTGLYVLGLAALLLADLSFVGWGDFVRAWRSPEIRAAALLSVVSCTLSTLLSLWIAVPAAYLLTRVRFRGQALLDTLLDVPIVLPPLVLGLSLLILFQTAPGQWFESRMPVTFRVPSVVLAQTVVACAFALRTMRATFEQMDPRPEQVAWTLGASRATAFLRVVLPQARGGVVAAATVAWARSLGEFGPILVFAGATRMRTEVLSTTVFLELSVGRIESAVAVSLVLVAMAGLVLLGARLLGARAGLLG